MWAPFILLHLYAFSKTISFFRTTRLLGEVARFWYSAKSNCFQLKWFSFSSKVFIQSSLWLYILVQKSTLSKGIDRLQQQQTTCCPSPTRSPRRCSPVIWRNHGGHGSPEKKNGSQTAVCDPIVHHPVKPFTKHCAENAKHLVVQLFKAFHRCQHAQDQSSTSSPSSSPSSPPSSPGPTRWEVH